MIPRSCNRYIMKNYGQGWKLWKRLKPGIQPEEYARKFNDRTKAILPEVLTYIDCLIQCANLEHRARLHTAVSLMPTDPDGVWSEFDDWSGYTLDLDDVVKCCRAYQVALDTVKSLDGAATATQFEVA